MYGVPEVDSCDECVCKVSPQSVLPFWRRFKKKKFKTRWLPNKVTYDIIILFFYGELLCRWCSRNFRFFLCSVVPNEFWPAHLLTDDVRKNHPCSPWGAYSNVWSENFFHCTVSEIKRSKVFRFFKMAPVPRDLWRHNYQLSMLSKNIHIKVKISCRSDLPFLRKWFLKRKNPQIAGGRK